MNEQEGPLSLKERIESSRLSCEARDLYWGIFSGTVLYIFVRALGSAFLVCLSVICVFIAETWLLAPALSSLWKACGFEADRMCYYLDGVIAFKVMAPILVAVFAGSFVSVCLVKSKTFQISSLSTVLVMFLVALSMAEFLVVSNLTFSIVLISVFLCMFWGYRLAVVFNRGRH